MTDRLTQIQDCLDQLLTQMYASIHYIDTRHPYAAIPGQSDQNPFAQGNITENATQPAQANPQENISSEGVNLDTSQQAQVGQEGEVAPDAPEVFEARLLELAQDLIVKEQQIEVLIDSLPGLGNSQESQEARITELGEQLRGVEVERKAATKEREALVDRVEARILSIRRV